VYRPVQRSARARLTPELVDEEVSKARAFPKYEILPPRARRTQRYDDYSIILDTFSVLCGEKRET
jgi:hypothetical protein